MTGYAIPGALVSTEWLAEHLTDQGVVPVEVSVDTCLYRQGHIPGAAGWSWKHQLADPVRRELLSRDAFRDLMESHGITHHHTVVLYGDCHNWFAAWAFWQLVVQGHADVRLLNGGRTKWELEHRPMSARLPDRPPVEYRLGAREESVRAMLLETAQHAAHGLPLIDVRSPDEFSGAVLSPPGLEESCQRGGHIPGAINIPWLTAVNEADSTFRSAESLRAVYGAFDPEERTIIYCRIGERSSHTWFVLRYLLGFRDVKNYDGSWTEWGNLVGAPISRTES
jgi:thiosulfate/3-mercaptopyruvate sulfurtransferase